MKADELKASEKADGLEDSVRISLGKKLAEVCVPSESYSLLEGKRVPEVLAAVSGGVDSMVMLTVLKKLSEPLSFTLHAVTINHNIRAEEETAGDAALVEAYCAKLGVPCTRVDLARNEVAETALSRGCGTEEAARHLRYMAFERERKACGASLVCIAHNRNDRLETVLGRFFQGAAGASASGMKQERDVYFRPLFDVTRPQIEAYAAEHAVPFRTDATNADNRYYRNRIRNELMPLLDSLIPGWDTAVLHGAEKNALIADALEKRAAAVKAEDVAVESAAVSKACVVSLDAAAFDTLLPAERIEALYQALYRLDTLKRVPYEMLRDFALGSQKAGSASCAGTAENGSRSWKVEGAGVVLTREGGRIIIKKEEQSEIDGFYCLIGECGRYSMPWGEILIRTDKERVGKNAYHAENIENGAISGKFPLPVIIRSRQPSDRILNAEGGHKEVSKLFSEWHIPGRYQAMLPVLESTEVLGVWGGVFGYPDYFVTQTEESE